ncbi:MAG: hypothetical protein AB1938_09955 [Myxococcota bacterium]
MRAVALLVVFAVFGCAPAPAPVEPLRFTAVTFNTGTSEGQAWTPDSGYGAEQAALSDRFYGDGLAWLPAVENTKAFFARVQPDVVAFQEIFHPGDCPTIPIDGGTGFLCERWRPGDPTVAQEVLGAGYQVACQLEKPDKCLGVKRSFGAIRGCAGELCLDGLAGKRVETCGSGSRVGRGVVDLPDGGAVTIVTVHGTSGISMDDQNCRAKQVDQLFVDFGLGDGPAAQPSPVLILGDFNTDPGRFVPADVSAVRWREFAGPRKPFHFLTAMGPDVPGTYGGLLNIDHVVSDVLTGNCWVAGVTPGHEDVNDFVYFDHKPHVCTVELPSP